MKFSMPVAGKRCANVVFAGTLLVIAAPSMSAEVRLDRDAVAALMPAASGNYWDHDQGGRYTVVWHTDGSMNVFPYAGGTPPAEDAEPVAKGTWVVREYAPKEGDTPEFIEAQNKTLRFPCCFALEEWKEGRTTCWDVNQVSFDTVEDSDELHSTQRYRMRREGGGQVVSFVIDKG